MGTRYTQTLLLYCPTRDNDKELASAHFSPVHLPPASVRLIWKGVREVKVRVRERVKVR